MKHLKILVLSIFCISLLSGASELLAKDKFTLNAPLPITGKSKKFGEMVKNATEIALSEINAKGGFKKGILKGQEFEINFIDTGSDKAKAVEIVERLIAEDKQPVIFGTYGSGNGFAMAEVAAKHGTPCFINMGSADKITQQGWQNVFRIMPASVQYLTGLRGFLNTVVKPKTMAILYEPTSYGKSASGNMKKICEADGIKIVYEEAYEGKATDFKPMLLKVKQTNPDVIFMVSYLMDATLLMKQSKELKINPKIFAGGAAGFVLPDFPKNAGAAAEGVVTSSLWVPGVKYPGARKFAEDYVTKYETNPSYHATLAYATTYVLQDILQRTGTLGYGDIIAASKKTDITTPFGRIQFGNFDVYTNQNKAYTIAMQVQDGELVTVWPKKVAEKKYRYPVQKW